jgi:hypothetical protein
MADDVKKYMKVLEKYGNDPNKVAEAYAELEEKFGAQGGELGTLRKQSEEATRAVQQYADYVNKAKPVVDWYAQNQDKIRDAWTKYANQSQAPRQTNTNSILTAEEQQALIDQATQYVREKELVPWTQQFAQTAESYVQNKIKEVSEAYEQKQKAFSQVWWKTLEHAVPQDKIASLKALHEEASKYADPSKIDPFKYAEEAIDTKAKLAEYEEKVKAFEKEKEARDKQSTPSLGNGQGLFPKAEPEDKNKIPQSRDERFSAVMNNVKTAHGNEGVDALFGKTNSLR